MKNKHIVALDVRPILSSGTDPFAEIMKTLETLSSNQTLLIINTFEPIPLLNKLKNKGYSYLVERPNSEEVHTFVSKMDEKPATDLPEVTIEIDFDMALKRFEGKMHELDVREYEMPMPMVLILEEIENLNEGHALFVHHKRLPQYLLPELEVRGFALAKKEIDSSNMKLIIFKKL